MREETNARRQRRREAEKQRARRKFASCPEGRPTYRLSATYRNIFCFVYHPFANIQRSCFFPTSTLLFLLFRLPPLCFSNSHGIIFESFSVKGFRENHAHQFAIRWYKINSKLKFVYSPNSHLTIYVKVGCLCYCYEADSYVLTLTEIWAYQK